MTKEAGSIIGKTIIDFAGSIMVWPIIDPSKIKEKMGRARPAITRLPSSQEAGSIIGKTIIDFAGYIMFWPIIDPGQI